MITEIEKTFFDTFGIEAKELEYPDNFTYYPEITDRILLGLICIANQYEDYPISTNIKNIQARTLRVLLKTEKFYKGSNGRYKKLVKQVRTLFKEVKNENRKRN